MSTVKLPLCIQCGVPHVPDDIKARVLAGEKITLEIIYSQGGVCNVLRWGTGALNIDDSRVATDGPSPAADRRASARKSGNAPMAARLYGDGKAATTEALGRIGRRGSADVYTQERASEQLGRWPANVAHDGSPEVEAAFARFGQTSAGHFPRSGESKAIFGNCAQPIITDHANNGFGDTGTAARFFFSAKASKDDRMGTTHPTTKPTELIRWLSKLVNPPGGTILDPFAGSGTLAVAATRLGMDAVLIDKDPESIAMINQRLRMLEEETPLFPPDVKRAEPQQGNLLDD